MIRVVRRRESFHLLGVKRVVLVVHRMRSCRLPGANGVVPVVLRRKNCYLPGVEGVVRVVHRTKSCHSPGIICMSNKQIFLSKRRRHKHFLFIFGFKSVCVESKNAFRVIDTFFEV